MKPHLILASSSPRRREMLAWLGLPFTIQPAEIDETPLPGEAPGSCTLRLAEEKARAAAAAVAAATAAGSSINGQSLVIASDTLVADNTCLLGKPANAADARRMLQTLRGRTHQVHTAIALYAPAENHMLTDLCTAQVAMRSYSEDEISDYIATRDPFDKAGAYAIQHPGFHPVENFGDCYACVMGLPLCHLARMLARAGVHPIVNTPNACQGNLGYTCPVYINIFPDQSKLG
jgi:septum formation protein